MVNNSLPNSAIQIADYDIIFLSGGWGAAYDFAQSEKLSELISQAYATKKILSAVCHGPLVFIRDTKPDGSPLVQDVKITGVTNKQLKQLFVSKSHKHPESELRKAQASYQHKSGLIDIFQNHVVVDKNHLIVTGKNQKAGIEAAQKALDLLQDMSDSIS